MARILMVEDDRELQALLTLMLRSDGHEIHHAFDGREGFEQAKRVVPELILLDLMMPLLNGFELLRFLIANPATRDIPVVVMTAYGVRAQQLKGALESRNVNACLLKPFEPAALLATVRGVLVSARPAEPA